MISPLLAICVGHSRLEKGRIEGGAISASGMAEHTYNSDLAERIKKALGAWEISCFIVNRYEGAGYTAAQKWLAKHLKERGATAAIELHFNDSETNKARGHEWLHWHSSKHGARLAQSLRGEYVDAFPLLPDRGVKALDNESRGAEFVKGTHCPAVICEPFFGDNPDDWREATTRKDAIALAIANGLAAFL